jgi:hypothetical protein
MGFGLAFGRAAVAFWLTLAIVQPAVAERRVALVVGNSSYANVPRLPNPRNDAGDMIARLKAIGFDVIPGLDLDRNGFLNTLATFGRAAEGADVALFFYAGHGLQVNGQNYLVPTDAKVEYEAELDIALIPVPLVMQQLARGSRVNIVLLDACRDNPFAKELSRSLGTRSSSALGRGLSRIQTASGTFIAFATQPDNVAQDGDGRNSPFTGALLANMEKPGLSLSDLMIEVRNEVMRQTNGTQVPWDSSSLTGRFSFKMEGTVTAAPQTGPSQPSAPASDTRAVELGVWNAIHESGDAAVFHRFLEDYPNSVFAPLARDRVAALSASGGASSGSNSGGDSRQSNSRPPLDTRNPTLGPPLDDGTQKPAPVQRLVKVFDNWNTGACALTNTASFRLDAPMQIANIELWYNWQRGEAALPFEISVRGRSIARGELTRGSCDPYQSAWCTAVASLATVADAGDYVVRVPRGRLCQNAVSRNNGFVRVRGLQ